MPMWSLPAMILAWSIGGAGLMDATSKVGAGGTVGVWAQRGPARKRSAGVIPARNCLHITYSLRIAVSKEERGAAIGKDPQFAECRCANRAGGLRCTTRYIGPPSRRRRLAN